MSTTSWQSKAKYNAKAYKVIQVQLKKELVESFNDKLKQDGITKAEFFRRAITKYLDEAEE